MNAIEIDMHIEVHAEAVCPNCRRRLLIRRYISDMEVTQEASPGQALTTARRVAAQNLRLDMVERGWSDVCGICREKRADDKANGVSTR